LASFAADELCAVLGYGLSAEFCCFDHLFFTGSTDGPQGGAVGGSQPRPPRWSYGKSPCVVDVLRGG
jgi:hypothetical protein